MRGKRKGTSRGLLVGGRLTCCVGMEHRPRMSALGQRTETFTGRQACLTGPLEATADRTKGECADYQVQVKLSLSKLTVTTPFALSAKCDTWWPTTDEPSGANNRTVSVNVKFEFFSFQLPFAHTVACPV